MEFFKLYWNLPGEFSIIPAVLTVVLFALIRLPLVTQDRGTAGKVINQAIRVILAGLCAYINASSYLAGMMLFYFSDLGPEIFFWKLNELEGKGNGPDTACPA